MNQRLQIAIIEATKTSRKVEWGEVVNGYKVFACHDAQLDILRSKAKFTFAFAGSGGGKTCLIPLWLFKQIAKNPRGRFLVVSPSVPTFESSGLKEHIEDTFADTIYEGSFNGKNVYGLASGGKIIVKTVGDGSDYKKLIGGQYDAAVADECYELTDDVFAEIRRRVSNKNGPILCVTTPTGNNWIWDYKQKAEAGDKDIYVRHWSKLANPTISLEDIQRERGLVSDATYKRMVMGEFSALEGLIYDCFSDPTSPRYPVIKGNPLDGLPSPPVRFFGGNDWGYKPDPSAVLMAAECEDGNVYIVEEIYGTEITPDDLAVKVRAMVDRWAIRVESQYADLISGGRFVGFYTDVSRPEEAAMFRKAGIPIKNKKVTDILAGIKITDSWLRAGRLKIYSTCTNLIREMKGYQWDSNRAGGLKDKPKGGSDHTADAFRYMISSHKYGVQVTPSVPTVAPTAAQELEKLIRHGLLEGDPTDKLKELEAERQNQRHTEMAFGNDHDDDPYGVWN